MAGIMDGFEAATKPGQDFTQAGTVQTSAAPAQPRSPEPLGTDVFGPGGYQFRETGYTTRTVDPRTGTVSGQLDSILAKDGLHMQRARSNALAMAADMGLRNSSIAVGNAQGALIDRATPIAQTDAQIYDGAARDNMQAANAAALASAQSYNQLGGIMIQERGQDRRLDKSQAFTAGQSALDRAQQTALQSSQQAFTAGQSELDRKLQSDLQNGRITADALQNQLARDQQLRIQELSERGMDRRQAESLAAQERQQRESQIFQSGENQLNRDQQLALFQKQVEADNARLLQQHDLTLKQMGFQSELNNANLPKQFAASVAQQTLDRINAISADPNLDPAAKRAAIQNVIDASNATAALGAKLYGVSVPGISMPGYSSGPSVAAPGSSVVYDSNGTPIINPPATTPLAPQAGVMGDGYYNHNRWRNEI